MNGWREFVQKWILRSAVKQGKKASLQTSKMDVRGILLIFPRDIQLARTLFTPIGKWLQERDASDILAVIPEGSEDEARKMHNAIKTVIVGEEDITRSELPSRDLRRHLAQTRSAVALLIGLEYDSFSEVLYAIAPSAFKCALFHPLRDPYSDLLVQPRQTSDPVKGIEFLLDALCTFAGNRIPANKTDDGNRRAVERFSNPTHPPFETDIQLPEGNPA